MPNLTSVKIFPPIGIARMGNSQETYIGPELPFPAAPPVPSGGKYKDNQCRIKRQAQRFRLWGYFDDNSNRELTAADGTIQWKVHLANAKAVFQGESGGLIDPGERTLNGPNDTATFANGTYHFSGLTVEVPLGNAWTDADGRLLVAGGFGFSSSPVNNMINSFWGNDGWHDDVSDGPVNATIVVNGQTFQATGAWVICPPPRYAPSTYAPTTLYDTMRQVALDQNLPGAPAPQMPPSFVNDIWPILRRGIGMLRVVAADFSPGDHGSLAEVIPPGSGQDAARAAIFSKLANPANPGNVGIPDMPANMPLLFTGQALGSNPADIPPALRPFQYQQMESWSTGNYVNDWPSSGQPPAPTTITPEGLTQAALENCIGAPFFPGIEATVTTRDGSLTYAEAFRLDQTNLSPGDVTKGMARPWQADFTDCTGTIGGDAEQWWPSARPVSVYPQQGSTQPIDWTNGLISGPLDMVDNWFRLGFIVDLGDGLPVQTEFLAVCKDCFIVTDRNEIGEEEAAAVIKSNEPIADAFFLVIEGYAPSDLGITTASPSPADLQMWFGNAVALTPMPQQMTVTPTDLLLEDNNALGQAQRVTVGYDVSFTGTNDFNFSGDASPITLNATVGNSGVGVSQSSAVIDLTKTVAPYMDHGAVSYLSNDTRVFKLQPQGVIFQSLGGGGVTLGNDPIGFINAAVNKLRGAASADAYNAFENLPAGESAADLEWLPELNGQPVYNFALCRVRYRATMTTAPNVRVFFRLFQTAATGTDYNSQTTYKWGGQPGVKIPLLGVQGGEVVTFPFFAYARKGINVDLNKQIDPLNVQPIAPDPGGKETYMYYGAWLDMNQNGPMDQRFPIQASSASGPFPESPGQTLYSIADLIRGTHQCMVAEISFDGDQIPEGISTASCAMLSQRNLVIDDSENPGATASRRVQHSFTIRPTTGNPAPRQGPDEMMIVWGDTPVGSEATIYLPGVRAAEVLALARKNFNLQTLEKVDDHTLRCRTAGVTYVPIPPGGTVDLAGLITVDLPAGIRKGQTFRIVVRQVVDRPAPPQPPPVTRQRSRRAVALPPAGKARYILGAFQFSVEVKAGRDILPADQRKLIALHRVLAKVPIENRWYPVLKRNFDQVMARFTALGGDPGAVLGGPAGSAKCRMLSLLCAAILAAFVVVVGIFSGVIEFIAGVVAAVAFVLALSLWTTWCKPDGCRILKSLLLGGAVGGGILSILALLGIATAQPAILLIVVIAVALLALAAALVQCW